MKTTIKKYLVVALMFGTLISYANGNKSSINILDGSKVKIEFNFVKKGHQLYIKHQNGGVLFNQEIDKTGTYKKIFDFSNLESGNYVAELQKDYEIILRPFTLRNGVVSFTTEEETIFKPVIRAEDNLVLISKISFSQEPTAIVIYYNDEVIYSETIKDYEEVINRVYKVSDKELGDYRVVVTSNDRSYIKEFKI